ncbi:MAG TPA: TIGR03435 family protein, partial [Vicinamibacterales bacterium]
MRRAMLVGIALVAAVAVTAAQSPLAFDVASVKEYSSPSETAAFGIMPPTPGRLRIVRTSLRFILHYAFQVRDHQLIGAPEWADSASFDITATFPAEPPRTEDDRRAMLRTLLADRFGLKTHREKR